MKYFLAIILTALSLSLFGQEKTGVELAYADDLYEIEVLDLHGNPVDDIDLGMIVPMGFSIRTYQSAAELRLIPNGTIIKLSADSFLKIETLQQVESIDTSTFALIQGKIRCVAARYSNSNYMIRTPSAVMGVRGTDFVAEVNEDNECRLYVNKGKVEFFDVERRESRMAEKGELISTIGDTFAAKASGIIERFTILSDMKFSSLNIDQVPDRVDEAFENTFEYFETFNQQAHERFFKDKKFFENAENYLEQFSDYYNDFFSELMEKVNRALEDNSIEERVEETLNKTEEKVKNIMDNLFNNTRSDD